MYSQASTADLRLAIRIPEFTPDKTTRNRIAKYFPVMVDPKRATKYKIKVKTFEDLLPRQMVKYKKLQILNGGDKIHANDSTLIDGIRDKRDSSFVRVRCIHISLL
jgi:hypothetical protein